MGEQKTKFSSFLDNMCLARSVICATEYYNNKKLRLSRYVRQTQLTRRCEILYQRAGYKAGGIRLGEIENFFKKIPEIFNEYKINIYDLETMGKRIMTVGKGAKQIFLLREGGHFNVIKSITGFRAARYYCVDCDKVQKIQ